MRQNVNANRMMLTRTRKRLAAARRGHTLMKHKLEELLRLFQSELDEVLELREQIDGALRNVYRYFVLGRSVIEPERMEALLYTPVLQTSITSTVGHLLNLRVPVLTGSVACEGPPYGLLDTSADLDQSVAALEEATPALLRLAQLEQRLMLLIREIETTRRRVNALEFVLIPQIEEQGRFIQMKLDEMERSNTSRLMRIKAIIRKEG